MNTYKLIILIFGVLVISCLSCASVYKRVSYEDKLIQEERKELEVISDYEITNEFEIADTFANSNLKLRVDSVKKCPFQLNRRYKRKELTERGFGKNGGTVLAINWLLGLGGASGSSYLFSLAPSYLTKHLLMKMEIKR